MNTKPTKASAVVVETLEPKEPKPIDVWIAFSWYQDHSIWMSCAQNTDEGLLRDQVREVATGFHVRIVHVTDTPPPDPDKKLRELLGWMVEWKDHGFWPLEGPAAHLKIETEIRHRLENPDGDS